MANFRKLNHMLKNHFCPNGEVFNVVVQRGEGVRLFHW